MTKHLVYKTTNLVNGKFYIGVHSGGNPNYLGSGVALKAAIKKYGRENFVRETINEFSTREEAYEYEKEVVDKDDPLSYNLSRGGNCGPRLKGSLNGMFGKKHSKQTRLKISNNMPDQSGSNNVFYGCNHTKEYKLTARKQKGKSLLIEDIEYFSSYHAAENLTLTRQAIMYRVRSPNFPDYQFL